uniref:Glycosyltransferase 2-like domain-containing protein n=1 Tax=viral metagenome TaxID=1070528 RepID=A0A6C0JLP7_9ZZZZ
MRNPTVSIITVTQLSRVACLRNLLTLIQLQTYENIIEWVIVEGSRLEQDAVKNHHKIKEIAYQTSFNIVYLEYTGDALSDLRNSGNDTCKGDIIVCMDDDDYYPRERVEDAVYKLGKSKCLIAGCSNIYIYDYGSEVLYKSKKLDNNHSTNNCMAFKREYLLTNAHESGLTNAEEKSFTKGFTEPMVQLSSKKCIVVSSHNSNTFDKRPLLDRPNVEKNGLFKKVKTHVTELIPTKTLETMHSIFTNTY